MNFAIVFFFSLFYTIPIPRKTMIFDKNNPVSCLNHMPVQGSLVDNAARVHLQDLCLNQLQVIT